MALGALLKWIDFVLLFSTFFCLIAKFTKKKKKRKKIQSWLFSLTASLCLSQILDLQVMSQPLPTHSLADWATQTCHPRQCPTSLPSFLSFTSSLSKETSPSDNHSLALCLGMQRSSLGLASCWSTTCLRPLLSYGVDCVLQVRRSPWNLNQVEREEHLSRQFYISCYISFTGVTQRYSCTNMVPPGHLHMKRGQAMSR